MIKRCYYSLLCSRLRVSPVNLLFKRFYPFTLWLKLAKWTKMDLGAPSNFVNLANQKTQCCLSRWGKPHKHWISIRSWFSDIRMGYQAAFLLKTKKNVFSHISITSPNEQHNDQEIICFHSDVLTRLLLCFCPGCRFCTYMRFNGGYILTCQMRLTRFLWLSGLRNLSWIIYNPYAVIETYQWPVLVIGTYIK